MLPSHEPHVNYYHPGQQAPMHRNHRYAPPPATNGMATAGLTLGIIGVVFAILPLVWIVSIPLPVLAVIFGAVGMGKGVKAGSARAGLVLGIIGVALYFFQWIYVASQLAAL